MVRPQRGAQPQRHRQRRLVSDSGRRRLRGGDRSERSGTIYAESQDGNVVRVNRRTNERKTIRPLPNRGESGYRWNWNTPIHISPHTSATIYVGGNRVFKSTDRGQSWTPISPDLTQNTDRETLSLMGTVRRSSPSPSTTACRPATSCSCRIAEAGRRAYAGADDGSVNMTKDGGKTWTNINARFEHAEERMCPA